MALTLGSAPFGRRPAGRFNFTYDAPDGILYLEDSPRRVRVVVAGQTIADTSHAKLLHEGDRLPVYYFPESDVRDDLLIPSDHTTSSRLKGEARYWTIRVGGDERENAVWSYPDSVDGVGSLAGLRAFVFDAVDEWWEEAERISVHARDPYHRCDVLQSDRHVVVRLGGQVVADSTRPMMLFESGLPPRFYLLEDDVRMEHLERTDKQTSCPYKGSTSRYYTIEAGGQRVENVAWVYDEVRAEVQGIEGRVAFFNEHVDLEVDGQAWERPRTPFS